MKKDEVDNKKTKDEDGVKQKIKKGGVYPTVLAFEKKIITSDALFYQRKKGNVSKKTIPVTEKTILGTISHKSAKDNEKKHGNIQVIDHAKLDSDCDILTIEWAFKVIPFSGLPSVCNEPEFEEKVIGITSQFLSEEEGITALCDRYALNILSGRWLWRNRSLSNEIDIEVYIDSIPQPLISLKNIKSISQSGFYDLSEEVKSAQEKLSLLIKRGFENGDSKEIKVIANLNVGGGFEVYPSLEFVVESRYSTNNKSKYLYSSDSTAAMHSQKIGNAIRTIDTWYNDELAEANEALPIAIEPFGNAVQKGQAYRSGKNSFYSLFEKWISGSSISQNDKLFVMATLIRGGIFGGK